MKNPKAIGRYEVLDSLTSGGMGSIYLARDPRIGNRRVAIKLMREGYDTPELRERFAREADAAGALHHPNIVTIFDVGDFDGQPFIAMEFIQGETLKGLIQDGPRMPVSRKLDLMIELCAGLHYAHRAGIVHRDIKPANVMVDQEGTLKILDFGIARLSGSGMTRSGSVIGTLNYMAPEQMAGQAVDPRADMFSAGAVFYELLSGRMAFPGELPAIVHNIITAERTPLARVMPDLDPALVAVVDRCLACDPRDRYPDMAAVRKDLIALRPRIASAERDRLATLLDQAAALTSSGDFEAAVDACEEALVLDPESTAAVDLRQKAKDGRDRHRVLEWTAEARRDLDRGALTAAALLIDRALALRPSSPDALAAFGSLVEARRRMAEAAERERRISALLDRFDAELERDDLEQAQTTLDETMAIDSPGPRAVTAGERLAAAFERRRHAEAAARAAAEEASARSAVDAARQRFARGEYAAAIQELKEYRPANPLVSDALIELLAEAQEIERRRAADERRRAEEEARQREAALRRADEERRRRLIDERRQREAAERERFAQEAAERERLAQDAAERERIRVLQEQDDAAPSGGSRGGDREAAERERLALEVAERDRAIASRARRLSESATRVEPDEPRHRVDYGSQFPTLDDAAPSGEETGAYRAFDREGSNDVGLEPVIEQPVGETQAIPRRGGAQATHDWTPQPPVPHRDSAKGRPWLIAGAAFAAVVLLAIGLRLFAGRQASPVAVAPASAPAPEAAGGEMTAVAIDVAPWARIEAITRAPGGTPAAPGGQVTPVVLQLPAGQYHVRTTNPNFGALEFDVTVESGSPQTVRRTMPGFNIEREIAEIVGK